MRWKSSSIFPHPLVRVAYLFLNSKNTLTSIRMIKYDRGRTLLVNLTNSNG